jgi:NADH-quinone oxidoreductase subunit F
MEQPLTAGIDLRRGPLGIEGYEATGGYQALHKALTLSPQEIQRQVLESNLRGRGGAGFSTGKKWNAVAMGTRARRPKYLIVNADEMEPGSFKDRLLLEETPHAVIEGTIIASYAVEAEAAYLFLRLEYRKAAESLARAIAEAYQSHYLGPHILGSPYSLELHLHVSAGRYMCGEGHGLLNALEGKRPIPRDKSPRTAVSGLWGHPSVINNVETLANIQHIIRRGPQWFKDLSYTDDGGTKLYGISGRVAHPGLWELPMGTTLGEILNEHAGGMQPGLAFKGLLPGGASTAFLVPEHMDLRLDFESPPRVGSQLGTGTLVVLDDHTCPVGFVLSIQAFMARESCGWCTPCREGLPWVVSLLEALEAGEGRTEDIDRLQEHTDLIQPGHTFCGLAPGAMESLRSALKYFRRDFEEHVTRHRCPWR